MFRLLLLPLPLALIGFWNASPGGCTVSERKTGGRLRWRYAAFTASTVGVRPEPPLRPTLTWRKRAFSLVAGAPGAGADQSVQVESGVEVLTARVSSFTAVPSGAWPSHDSRPQLASDSASFTRDTKLPRAAGFPSSASTRAGLAVTSAAPSPAAATTPVTCSPGSVATSS